MHAASFTLRIAWIRDAPLLRFPMNICHRTRYLVSVVGLIFFSSAAINADAITQMESDPKPVSPASSSLAPGAYFNQKLPGEKPELFAPGIINVPNRSVGRIAFSPDGTECAFTVFESIYANNRIFAARYENGAWTSQRALAGIDGKEMLEPLFSRDNDRLYFSVKTPGNPPAVAFAEIVRTPDGWSKPKHLPAPLNSDHRNFCLAQSADGTMYFASDRGGGRGGLDLYRTVAKPGKELQVENLGTPVNSASDDGDPAISPDGHILVFYSEANRPRHTGNSDLFICFDNGQGGWTNPVNMGKGFNTPVAEYAATFSHDGRVLFFVRFNGQKSEVYWVSTAGLERFRTLSAASGGEQENAIDLPPERKSISVSTDILRRYVGTYAMKAQPGLTNDITLEADQLMTQLHGQPKVPLFAESENKFFLKVAEVQMEFVTNGEAEVTGLIIHQSGMNIEMARLKPDGGAVTKP
jgi:Tol biopolymer transport system component